VGQNLSGFKISTDLFVDLFGRHNEFIGWITQKPMAAAFLRTMKLFGMLSKPVKSWALETSKMKGKQ
jgi:hypothetical protein